MKKIILMLFLIFLFAGCTTNLMNTPTKKVEAFFSKYQSLDEDVINQIKDVTDTSVFTDSQKEKYMDIMRRHYESLKYHIKDEVIDGDSALVVVEIEVIDYSKYLKEASEYLNNNKDKFTKDGQYDETLYNDYRLEKLKNVDDKVKWTVDISLSKVDNEWIIDNLDQDTMDKIQGVYQY